MKKTINDRPPNFRKSTTGKLYLVRCFACEPKKGRENFAPAVASGKCVWCGWPKKSKKSIKKVKEKTRWDMLEFK